MKQSWRLYIVVIFLVLGGIFQFIGSFNSEGSPETITAMELAGLDLQPFSISNTNSKARKNIEDDIKNFKNQKRGKLSMKDVMFPRNHSFDETKKKGKKTAKKKGKKKDKKKSDKSTQVAESTVSFEPERYAEDETQSDSPEGIENDETPAAGVGGLAADQDALKDGDIPQTFEEWEVLVLRSAHKKNTAKLIEYHQSNLIPQGVFYQVVGAMLQDSSLALRKLGVEAAGATPSLQSFTAMAMAMENESHGSEIRGLIISRLASYQMLNHVSFLRQVLTASESDFPLIIAAQQVQLSAQRNLQTAENTDDNSSQGNNNGLPVAHPNASQFDRLIPLLNGLSSTASSPQLIEAAQDAIQTIEDLLG